MFTFGRTDQTQLLSLKLGFALCIYFCLQNIFHPISVSRKEGDPLSKAYDGTVYLYSSVFRLLRSFCYSLKWHTLIMHSIFHIIVKKTGFLDWSKHWLKFFCIFLQNINHTLFKENIDKASSFFISLGSIMFSSSSSPWRNNNI